MRTKIQQNIQQNENKCIKMKKILTDKKHTKWRPCITLLYKHWYLIKEHEKRWWQCRVTIGRRGHSRHSYLEKPWHRCWWRTWSWGWGCCHPHCGTWQASPRSGVPGSPRCSGTSSGTESEPHRCRGGKAGWRTACRHTLCLRSSLWSCGLQGTCAENRQ